jgi:hypothetical protein
LGLNDDVFEDLVESVADMEVAIGEGRAVMQHEFLGRAGAGRLNRFIKLGFLPFLEPLRFARHQIRFHREIGARQIQCIFVVHVELARSVDATGQPNTWQAGKQIQ